jgi:hypothetical protein
MIPASASEIREDLRYAPLWERVYKSTFSPPLVGIQPLFIQQLDSFDYNCIDIFSPLTKMSFKLNPPFRAEHLGSLLRPEELLKARMAFEKKELSPEELKTVEDKAIEEVVKLQKEVGLKGISDGEYRLVDERTVSFIVIESAG